MELDHQHAQIVSDKPHLDHLAPAFFALHIAGGHVSLPIMTATFLISKKVSRHPTLINFCITWIIYSISYSLSQYSGKTMNPSSALCFAQSAMVHGAPTMCSVSTLIVVGQVWWTFRDPHVFRRPRISRPTGLAVALTLPYLTYIGFTVLSAILQVKQPGMLGGIGLYCTFTGGPFRQWGVPSFCTGILVLIIGFQVAIGIRFYRTWRQISTAFPLADRKTSPTLVIRVLIFNIYSIVILCAGISSLLGDSIRAWPYFVQAALPLTAVGIFGTQKDLWTAWFYCRRERKGESHTSTEESMPRFRRRISLTQTETSGASEIWEGQEYDEL